MTNPIVTDEEIAAALALEHITDRPHARGVLVMHHRLAAELQRIRAPVDVEGVLLELSDTVKEASFTNTNAVDGIATKVLIANVLRPIVKRAAQLARELDLFKQQAATAIQQGQDRLTEARIEQDRLAREAEGLRGEVGTLRRRLVAEEAQRDGALSSARAANGQTEVAHEKLAAARAEIERLTKDTTEYRRLCGEKDGRLLALIEAHAEAVEQRENLLAEGSSGCVLAKPSSRSRLAISHSLQACTVKRFCFTAGRLAHRLCATSMRRSRSCRPTQSEQASRVASHGQ